MPTSARGVRKRKKREKRQSVTPRANTGSDSGQHTPSESETGRREDEEEEESLWTTFSSHPLVQVSAVIIPVYLLYRSYFFFVLQHPEYLRSIGLNNFRPSVGLTDERQLLIVGTMSSGTTQVAAELSNKLKLEIAHEASDANWYFCRDGTISSFHGIRFLQLQPSNNAGMRLVRFCSNFTANMGFHPSMYRSNSTCEGDSGRAARLLSTSTASWSACWAKECYNLLSREFGCAIDDSKACETPFRRTLHQVRHPLRTVESLVTKFCVGGVDGSLHPSFAQFFGSLFDFYEPNDSCIEACTKYVLFYTQGMLEARSQGKIADMYRVEDVSPCEIAEMAGLLEEKGENDAIVYEPNRDKIQRICQSPNAAANEKMPSNMYQVNRGQLTLDWIDLRGGIHGSTRPKHDTQLEMALRKLTLELGYQVDEEDASSS